MTAKTLTGTDIESLMDKLASKDGMVRQKARDSLVALGKPTVASLIIALKNSTTDQVRWEAAKALGAIKDARSIPTLVAALSDSNSDVTWLAAEALSDFKMAAWPPLLRAIVKSEPSPELLYRGAHHVLLGQKEDGFDDLLAVLMEALEHGELSEWAVVAAHNVLEQIEA